MTESAKKGYWIAHVRVDDPENYKKYVEGARASFEKYGAKFIARGLVLGRPSGTSIIANP